MAYSIVRDDSRDYDIEAPDYVSEIFPLKYDNPNTYSFELQPDVGKELGNSVAWRLTHYFANLVIIWQDRKIWLLSKPDKKIPDREQWMAAIKVVREQLKEDFGDSSYSLKLPVRERTFSASVWAEIARRLLQNTNFNLPVVFNKNNVKVQREVKFWAETIALKNLNTPEDKPSRIIQPAIALSLNSQFIAASSLADFYTDNLEKGADFLIGLSVKTIETRSTATIVELAGTVGERRQELIDRSASEFNKKQLRNAADNQQIVRVKFGKENKTFDYPLSSLSPLITAETVERFELKYG